MKSCQNNGDASFLELVFLNQSFKWMNYSRSLSFPSTSLTDYFPTSETDSNVNQ